MSLESDALDAQIWFDITARHVFAEQRRSRAKFPGNRFMLAALAEEVGELAEAIARGDKDQIRIEAIQVASTAIRIAEEGDSTEYGPYGFIKLAISVGNVARFLMQRKPVIRSLEDASNAIRVLWAGEDDTFANITDEEAKP